MLTVPGLMLALGAFLVCCRLMLIRSEHRAVIDRQDFLPFVGLSNLCAALALAAQSLMDNSEMGHNAVLLGALYLTSAISLQYAMARRFGFQAPLTLSYAVMAAVLTGISYFSTLQDNMQMRILLLNSGMAAIYLMVVPQILAGMTRDVVIMRVLAVAYFFSAAMAVLRGVAVVVMGAEALAGDFTVSASWKWMLAMTLFYSLCFCAICILNVVYEVIDGLQDQRDTDPLSGLSNRRGFFNRVLRLIEQRPQQPWFLVAADLDHFKRINDECGHHKGDEVISAFGAAVRALAPQDHPQVAGRIGGEEFVVLLPAADMAEAAAWAEALRLRLSALPLLSDRPVTASFGVDQIHNLNDIGAALRRVDGLLYQAKSLGRNCVKAGTARPVRLSEGLGDLATLPVVARRGGMAAAA